MWICSMGDQVDVRQVFHEKAEKRGEMHRSTLKKIPCLGWGGRREGVGVNERPIT